MATTKTILTFNKAKMKAFPIINVINMSTLLHAYRQVAENQLRLSVARSGGSSYCGQWVALTDTELGSVPSEG